MHTSKPFHCVSSNIHARSSLHYLPIITLTGFGLFSCTISFYPGVIGMKSEQTNSLYNFPSLRKQLSFACAEMSIPIFGVLWVKVFNNIEPIFYQQPWNHFDFCIAWFLENFAPSFLRTLNSSFTVFWITRFNKSSYSAFISHLFRDIKNLRRSGDSCPYDFCSLRIS